MSADDPDEPEDELAARRESGGSRATKRKHDERAARRRRAGWSEAAFRKRVAALGHAPTEPEEIFPWAVKQHAILLEEALTDPGPPPEQRREQAARISVQLTKLIDVAKLSAKLAEYERALEELRARAEEVDPGTNGGAGPGASQ